MRRARTRRRGCALLLTLSVGAGIACAGDRDSDGEPPATGAADTAEAPAPDSVQVTLYFTDREELETADCAALLPVTRTIPAAAATPEGMLRLLLGGTLPAERDAGRSDSFQPAPAVGTDRPLIEFLRGVEVRNDTAYLDFTPGGLSYLNNAACLQGAVKAPIERTLEALPSIDVVRYRIDGQVYEDWDA